MQLQLYGSEKLLGNLEGIIDVFVSILLDLKSIEIYLRSTELIRRPDFFRYKIFPRYNLALYTGDRHSEWKRTL